MRSIFFFILWFLVQPAVAQEANLAYNRLGLLVGGQQTHVLDQQFSPLVYRANELRLALYYEAKHHRSNWHASLEGTTGSLFPPQYADRMVYTTTEDIYGNITTDSFQVRGNTRTINLQIGYAHDLVQSGDFALSVGADVRNQLMYPTTFLNLGIMNALSLLVTTNASWFVNQDHQLSLGVGIPVFGWNTRFPYSGTVSTPNQTLTEAFFDGGTELVSLDKYSQFKARCKWRMALSSKAGVGLQYDFMWQRYTIPATLKHYSGSIGVTFDINI
jgi:hypothetical protein